MMHDILIREQSENLIREIEWLLGAQKALMQATTGLNPVANLVQAKKMIREVAERLPVIAMRIG